MSIPVLGNGAAGGGGDGVPGRRLPNFFKSFLVVPECNSRINATASGDIKSIRSAFNGGDNTSGFPCGPFATNINTLMPANKNGLLLNVNCEWLYSRIIV